MKKALSASLAALVVVLAALAGTTGVAAGASDARQTSAAPSASNARVANVTHALASVERLLAQSQVSKVELQQLVTQLKQVQAGQLELSKLVTQLQQLQSSLSPELRQLVQPLLTSLQAIVQPQQLASLISKLEQLLAQESPSAAEIRSVLQQLQQLLSLQPDQLRQVFTQLRQVLATAGLPTQLTQLLQQIVGQLLGGIAIVPKNVSKVTVCHRTGSKTNPYTVITVSLRGYLNGHARHPGDILVGAGKIKIDKRVCPSLVANPIPTVTELAGLIQQLLQQKQLTSVQVQQLISLLRQFTMQQTQLQQLVTQLKQVVSTLSPELQQRFQPVIQLLEQVLAAQPAQLSQLLSQLQQLAAVQGVPVKIKVVVKSITIELSPAIAANERSKSKSGKKK
ncbi:MAG TPA: hypothetical protein VNT58_04430 [Gaiellaceae bacterium]|nr:hypothetical protein [Gaiellaceae bacterium]